MGAVGAAGAVAGVTTAGAGAAIRGSGSGTGVGSWARGAGEGADPGALDIEHRNVDAKVRFAAKALGKEVDTGTDDLGARWDRLEVELEQRRVLGFVAQMQVPG